MCTSGKIMITLISFWNWKRSTCCQLLPSSARTFQSRHVCAHRHNEVMSKKEKILKKSNTQFSFVKLLHLKIIYNRHRTPSVRKSFHTSKLSWKRMNKLLICIQQLHEKRNKSVRIHKQFYDIFFVLLWNGHFKFMMKYLASVVIHRSVHFFVWFFAISYAETHGEKSDSFIWWYWEQ